MAQDNSKIVKRNDLYLNLHIPLIGGKGGFGSMLRAIGAQIEKTTNKEACRDLSGRRLRDVKAEKRIKNWIKRKAELKKEQERKKREKLERLTQAPKIEFKDDEYLKEKDVIPQKVDDAIDYVLKKKRALNTKSDSTDKQQPSTSSSDNENRLTNSEENSNDSNKSNDKIKINQPNTIKRKQDEIAIVSKKKKVPMFFGDDLDSSEDDE